jgi:CubicO group peptidase (beta-lactamase class C family)
MSTTSSFYLDVDSATYQANFDANTANYMRLVAIAMRDNNGTPLYSAAWVPSDGRQWVACNGVDYNGLLNFYATNQKQGLQMTVLASTESLFSAVMEAVPAGATPTQFVSDLSDSNLSNTLNAYQAFGNNFAPRCFAIYGAPGATRRYAAVFEPCSENWAYQLWLTDQNVAQYIDAYFNDLCYRPTLLTYSPDSFLFCVFRDDSIGANNWTAGNALTPQALTAKYNAFSDRGLWPSCISVNDNDTFACVMVGSEKPLPRQFSANGVDVAGLAQTLDPLVQSLMQSPNWKSVGQPRVISIAVAYQQRLMFAKAYTWADATYPVAGPTSQFRLASCSKPITSIATGCLLQSGALSPTDTVGELGLAAAPGGAFPSGFSNINVAELRSHRSGLQPLDSSGPPDATVASAYGHPTPIDIYDYTSYWLTNASVATGFPSTTNLNVQYQDCNYGLLGLLIRAKTNGSYYAYVQQAVLSLLGLTRPSIGASLHSQRAILEVQHHSSGPSSVGPNAVTQDPPIVGSGYGTNFSENLDAWEDWSFSTVDYTAILAAIGIASQNKNLILNGHSIATLFTQIDPSGATDNFTEGGLFWGISPKGVTVYAHNGGWGIGGANIATWIMTRSDGVSAAVFMNMDDPPSGQLWNFVWQESNPGHKLSGQFQNVLDSAAWPATGDAFPEFGITGL